MATDDSNARNPGGNPGITDIEPATVTIAPDYTVAGDGFHTVLDQSTALDSAMRIIGALARLRGWVTP